MQYYLAFNKNWFNRHQKTLLWFLNAPIIKRWSRWIMAIDKSELAISEKIYVIMPNHFSYNMRKVGDDLEITTDFRGGPTFGKQIYYAFRHIWWVMHFWDWLVADRFCFTELSFGFNSLTAVPVAGANSPCDGQTERSPGSESLTTIRAGAGTGFNVTSTQVDLILWGSTVTNQFQLLRRGYFLFDTSGLGSSATITNAVISFTGNTKSNNMGSPDFHVAACTPAATNTLANADYGQCQTTTFGNIAYASFLTDNTTYMNITLNASGISNISKTGISKFSTQLSYDINNNFTGTWSNNGIDRLIVNAVDAGASSEPKLVVTYTIPGSSKFFQLFL